ncbi:hypothetical protein D3C83_211790 [compost metagenome]
MAAAVQAFVAATLAVVEFEVEALHPIRPGIMLGDAMDGRQLAGHGAGDAS